MLKNNSSATSLTPTYPFLCPFGIYYRKSANRLSYSFFSQFTWTKAADQPAAEKFSLPFSGHQLITTFLEFPVLDTNQKRPSSICSSIVRYFRILSKLPHLTDVLINYCFCFLFCTSHNLYQILPFEYVWRMHIHKDILAFELLGPWNDISRINLKIYWFSF